MTNIVLIDDNHGPMDLYVRALQVSGFEVQHLDSVESAVSHVQSVAEPAGLYIIDVMMPPQEALDLEESSYGLTSGILIYRRLRKKFPAVPVIILTNISTPGILEELPVEHARTTVEAKIDVLPFDLVGKVKEAFEKAKEALDQ